MCLQILLDTNIGNKRVCSGGLSSDLAVVVFSAAHFLNYMELGWFGFSFTSGDSSVRWGESPLTAGQGLRSCHNILTSVSKLLSKHCPTSSFSLSSHVDSLFGQEFFLTPCHLIMEGKWEPKASLEVTSLVRLIEQN